MFYNVHQGFQSGLFGPWAIKGQWGHNLKLTLDILKLQMKSKKKVIGVFIGNYSFNGIILNKLIGGEGTASLISLNKDYLKKVWKFLYILFIFTILFQNKLRNLVQYCRLFQWNRTSLYKVGTAHSLASNVHPCLTRVRYSNIWWSLWTQRRLQQLCLRTVY